MSKAADYLTYSIDYPVILSEIGEKIYLSLRKSYEFFMSTARFGKSFKQLIEIQSQDLKFFVQSISFAFVLIIAAQSLYQFL